MMTLKETKISKKPSGSQLFVEREFEAPTDLVWRAWTEKELLDQWWAPHPWRTETKEMDFREGGYWLYSMNGPDGEKSWCRADYTRVIPQKSFSGDDGFTDEEGNLTNEFPVMHWKCDFIPVEDGTRVEVEIGFDSDEDLRKIVEMGFKEGFTAAHGNLDVLLSKLVKG